MPAPPPTEPTPTPTPVGAGPEPVAPGPQPTGPSQPPQPEAQPFLLPDPGAVVIAAPKPAMPIAKGLPGPRQSHFKINNIKELWQRALQVFRTERKDSLWSPRRATWWKG